MPKTHAETLLALVRAAMSRRGWNTAALAAEMGRDRGEVRTLLSGRTPLVVDDFFAMVEALKLGPEEMGLALPAGVEIADVEASEPAPAAAEEGPRLGVLPPVEGMAPEGTVDPDAPQAEHLFRLGFGLGIDMHFVCDPAALGGSGVPAAVLSRFPQGFPIKLDAAYHRHNRPRYVEDGIELRLSFDRVYTCFFPYRAIRAMSFTPLPPPEAPPEEPAPTPKGRPTLTLVK